MAEADFPKVYHLEDNPRRRPHKTVEPETSNEFTENNTRRRHFQQNMRPPHTGFNGRGRGRARMDPHVMKAMNIFGVRDSRTRMDPHVMKAMNIFGVRDLRELLDRKHDEEQLRDADTSYNYLSDPEREDFFYHQQKGHSSQTQIHQDGPSRGPRGRGNNRGREKTSFIQNPLNIRVQFSTSTGERNCLVDRKGTLNDIRHVPDHMYSLEPFTEGSRGRGVNWRGRPREPRGRGSEERGRCGDRMGRGRGRGWSTRSKAGEVGDGTELRAKSIERSDQLYENEGKQYKARGRGRYVRSRSVENKDRVETRDERDTRDVDWEPRARGAGARGRGQWRGRGKRQSNPPERKTQVPDIAAEQYADAEENLDEPSKETDEAIGDVAGSLLLLKEKAEMKKEKSVNNSSNRVTRKRSVRFNLKNNDTAKAGIVCEENPDNKNECLEQEKHEVSSQNEFVDSDEPTKEESYDRETEEVVNADCNS